MALEWGALRVPVEIWYNLFHFVLHEATLQAMAAFAVAFLAPPEDLVQVDSVCSLSLPLLEVLQCDPVYIFRLSPPGSQILPSGV